MANLHLVTGYGGSDHVTAADDGSLNAAIFGEGQYVLKRGNCLAASVINNNTVRIMDGDILMQGRHVRLNEGTYVDLTIENGAQGMKRVDLIVCRYTKNTNTGVEECNLVVIKGTESSDYATMPEVTLGDIITDHAVQSDFPLYSIYLDGLTVEHPVAMYEVMNFNDSIDSVVGLALMAQAAADNAQTAANNAQLAAENAQVAADVAGTKASGKAVQFFFKYTGNGATNRTIYCVPADKMPSIAMIAAKGQRNYAQEIMVVLAHKTWDFNPEGFMFLGLGTSAAEVNSAQGECVKGGIKIVGGTDVEGFNVNGYEYFVWGLIDQTETVVN